MILKALLSGLWVFPERRCLAVIFTLDPCFTFQFHCGTSFHLFPCDPTLSVFASQCQGESHAVKVALCDLGDPGCGEPWFLHWAVLLPTPSELAPVVFVAFLVLFVSWWGPASSSLTAWKLNLTPPNHMCKETPPPSWTQNCWKARWSTSHDPWISQHAATVLPMAGDISSNLKRTKRRSEWHRCLGVDAPFQLKN